MKPVAIFRHYPTEGPGYFATFLERNNVPWQLICIDQGAPIPPSCDEFSGLALMGGPMSVNDDLAWIPPLLKLIASAIDGDIPVIGHCLGGQLMSKALGGVVSRNPVKEIGWAKVSVVPTPMAHTWLNDCHEFIGFHWHGETFTIPTGAERILSSSACANQAFVLGKHLGMQCHVEMTEELIRSWCDSGAQELAKHAAAPSVQSADAILGQMAANLLGLRAVADRLYSHWIQGLA